MMRLFYSVAGVLAVFFIMAGSVHAQGLLPLPTGTCSGELQCYLGKCVASGSMKDTPSSDALPCNYTLSDILQTAINGLNLIFAITGSIALLMFVYGGFLWLISAGSAEKIKQGTGILKNSVIAIIIILGASMIVRFLASDIFVVGVIESGQFKVGEAVCATAPEDTGCGDNSVCYRSACVTKCDQKAATDAAHAGYRCQQKLLPAAGDCKTGLCPGDKNIQCCITKERQKAIEESKK